MIGIEKVNGNRNPGTFRRVVLLVGGTRDGQYVNVDTYYRTLEFLIFKDLPVFRDASQIPILESFEIESYEMHMIRVGRSDFIYYAHVSLTEYQAIRTLFNGYGERNDKDALPY